MEVKLTDFGIGQVVSQEYLAGVTKAGFTMTLLGSESSSSHTGTPLYMAPELLAGKPASTRSDIYSLGVVLYQLLVGDFGRPVATDWANEIADPLLRDDLRHCFAGNPQDRFVGAAELGKNLRAWEQRKAEVARRQVEEAERERLRQAEKAALERAAYRRGMMRTAGVATVIVAVIAGLALVALNQSRRAKASANAEKQERVRAEHSLYVANMNLTQQAAEQNNVGRLRELLEQTASYPARGFEWYYWQRQLHLELMTLHRHSSNVVSVAFSPDGQRIVTGSLDGTAKVWDAASGKELLTLHGYDPHVHSVAVSPDGQRIVTGACSGTSRIWDAASGKLLHTLKGHTNEVCSVAFSPDGRRIATGSADHTARVWDAASGQLLHTLKGHTSVVTSVAFSPNGQRIATGGGDYTAAKVSDAASGDELFTLDCRSWLVSSVAFSPEVGRLPPAVGMGSRRSGMRPAEG